MSLTPNSVHSQIKFEQIDPFKIARCEYNGISVSDGNRKLIKPNGEFWVNGELLGRGRWITLTRYAVLVERWGNIWWVGELTSDGLVTVIARSKSELFSVKPQGLEKFINPEISVSDGNRKLIKPNGEFWVNGELLGKGKWITPTRYAVLVERWGNIWWVGELTSDGLVTVIARSKSELFSVKPQGLERFTHC